MDDKRKFPRIPLDVQVNFSQSAMAQSRDISEGGMCIISEEQLEEGKICTMVFDLPTGVPVKCFGKIIWSRQGTENYFEQGIEFWDIDDSDRKKIQNYFEQQQD